MQETRVWSLGWEDPLEKEMATRSSTIAWRIPWTEEPGGLQSTGSQRVGHNWATSLSLTFLFRCKEKSFSVPALDTWGYSKNLRKYSSHYWKEHVKVKVWVVQSYLTLCNPMVPARLLCPWKSPEKNTEVSSHSLHQGIFPTQGSNLGCLHYRQILHHLSHHWKEHTA